MENYELIVGAWRNGASQLTLDMVDSTLKRKRAGKNLLGYEVALLEMYELLESYDTISTELLTGEPVAA